MTSRTDLLYPVKLKVHRANHHMVDLMAAVGRFNEACNTQVVAKEDLITAERVYYLPHDIPIPDEIHHIIGDVVGNLRSALDRLAYAACVHGTEAASIGPRQAKNIAFPVAPAAAKYASVATRQLQALPTPAVIAAFRKLEPYPGGEQAALFHLHALANTDKHRLPLQLVHMPEVRYGPEAFDDLAKHYPGAAAFAGVVSPEDLPAIAFGVGPLCATTLQTGDVLLRAPLDSKLDKDLRFTFDVGLKDAGAPEEWPASTVLRDMFMETVRVASFVAAAID